MTVRTNKQLVLEAVEDLHRLEQIVTRETLANHTGLKLSVIDDRLKALVADERIVRVQRGVFVPVAQHPPARQISHTELPDGTVVLDIGDEVLHLTPREARTLGAMLGGRAMQAAQVDIGHAAAFANSELTARIRQLERQIEMMMTAVIKAA
jgi:hypothetical protein